MYSRGRCTDRIGIHYQAVLCACFHRLMTLPVAAAAARTRRELCGRADRDAAGQLAASATIVWMSEGAWSVIVTKHL